MLNFIRLKQTKTANDLRIYIEKSKLLTDLLDLYDNSSNELLGKLILKVFFAV